MNVRSTRLGALMICGALAFCAACMDDDDPPPPGGSMPQQFVEVDEAARAAFEMMDLSGMGLAVYDGQGEKVFERMYGDFSPDRSVALASASKLVSGVVIFRLITQGYLSLDSTTAEVLGWSGEKGTITLRHLLSFTSGLRPEHRCTYQANTTLAACVDLISRTEPLAPPGTRFDYGSTHLHVAGRMAEVAVGTPWNEIFTKQIAEPLGLASDAVYYADPLRSRGTTNPLLAGGLRLSMNDYAKVLRLVFDKGKWQGETLVAPELFDEQAATPFPQAVIGRSPAQYHEIRYGLTAWLECSTPASGCATISSPGAFGFLPWLDRATGYYAILAMEQPFGAARRVSVPLEQELQPLIEHALAE